MVNRHPGRASLRQLTAESHQRPQFGQEAGAVGPHLLGHELAWKRRLRLWEPGQRPGSVRTPSTNLGHSNGDEREVSRKEREVRAVCDTIATSALTQAETAEALPRVSPDSTGPSALEERLSLSTSDGRSHRWAIVRKPGRVVVPARQPSESRSVRAPRGRVGAGVRMMAAPAARCERLRGRRRRPDSPSW